MTDNDREAYRRNEDGSLTIWGARDVIADLTDTGVYTHVDRDALSRALDDLEEAVIRTHDRFGCAEDVAEDEGGFTCSACRTSRALCRALDEVEMRPGSRAALDLAESLEQLGRGEVVPASFLGADDGDFVEHPDEVLRGGRRLSVGEDEEHHVVEMNTYDAYARALDDEDRAVEAALGARRSAAEIKRSIRSGLPPEPPEGWDAVAEVRADRDADARRDDALRIYTRAMLGDAGGYWNVEFPAGITLVPGDVVELVLRVKSDGRPEFVSVEVGPEPRHGEGE